MPRHKAPRANRPGYNCDFRSEATPYMAWSRKLVQDILVSTKLGESSKVIAQSTVQPINRVRNIITALRATGFLPPGSGRGRPARRPATIRSVWNGTEYTHTLVPAPLPDAPKPWDYQAFLVAHRERNSQYVQKSR